MRSGYRFCARTWVLRLIRRSGLGVAGTLACIVGSAQTNYVNFEGKQTSPVRLSPDGTRLVAVNTPDARLSVFDVSHSSNPTLIAEIPVGIEPVSVNPLTSDEVWVVNEVSDSISIVSISQRLVTDTLYVQDEPADVVFAGGKAFVSAARNNQIAVFDISSHARLATIPVFGENPRALAVSIDGTKIYAAFALSGNHTTLIPDTNAPPQSPPTNTNLPAPPQVGLIVDAGDPAWTNIVTYRMPDNDVVEIDAGTLAITRYFTNVGTLNLGLAVRPDNGDLYVANTDARNLVHFETNLRGHLVENRITQIDITSGARTFYDLNPGVDYSIVTNLPALTNALAQPTAIVFEPSGGSFYVAAFGTDRVARLDNAGNIIHRIEAANAIGSSVDPRHKRGPRGLALKATAQRLYILNRISNTISIVDTTSDTVLKELPVGGFDPTPDAIRQGRGFLYDAKLSGNGNASCAACHPDAEMDRIAWDLGNPDGDMQDIPTRKIGDNVTITLTVHPMKGPLTTQTLRGLKGMQPFHWRGDRTNFSHFNVAFPALLGGAPLSTNDMTAFTNFIDTIVFEPNPNQNLDRTYPTNFNGGNAQNGFLDFQFQDVQIGLLCTSCHTLPPAGTGTSRRNRVAAASEDVQFQNIKVPQLRNVYQKTTLNKTPGADSIAGFGIAHDGVEPSVFSFLHRPIFQLIGAPGVRNDLEAFCLCFDTGMAPAVGYSVTLAASNVNTPTISNTWSLLENQSRLKQANVTNIQLIVKGILNGARHGFLFQPGLTNYLADSTNIAPLTRAQLTTRILAGDTLTLMGVPSGSGNRMAIDRDSNGVRDGDEPPPNLQVSRGSGSVVLSWPYAAAGYILESAIGVPNPPWTPAAEPTEISGGQNVVTNLIGPQSKYYRLRSL